MMRINPGIEIDPDRRSGRPVIVGTSFTMAQLIAEIAEGQTPDEVAEEFELDETAVRAALDALSQWLNEPWTDRKPSGHVHGEPKMQPVGGGYWCDCGLRRDIDEGCLAGKDCRAELLPKQPEG